MVEGEGGEKEGREEGEGGVVMEGRVVAEGGKCWWQEVGVVTDEETVVVFYLFCV